MLRYILAFIIFMHGLIHFMGFAKAFNYGNMKQLTIPITKPIGVLWMVTAFLFIITVILFLLKKEYWWMIAVVAVILSQVVIIMSWKDAKFGTIANIIVLVAAVAGWGSSRFENSWKKDVEENLQHNSSATNELLTEADLQHLPPPVQQYLKYTGVLNKPKVKNMRIVFAGEMRDKGKDYFPFRSVQYNFFNEPARLFFMKGKMFGVTVPGYHHYKNSKAVMDIRLFGLFPIVQKSGDIMDKAETVTLFNDMCLMAPATLIDKRIEWQVIDSNSVKAIFTNHNISISANLYFNDKGQLIDFVSSDRTAVSDMKQHTWSTPISEYKTFGGYTIFSSGDAVWHYPDGKFVYGKFNTKEVEYNVKTNTQN
jgi:hypothetical protein